MASSPLRGSPPSAALAIDVGGTKIAAGLVDRAGRVLDSAEQPTPAGEDAAAVFGALVAAVQRVCATGGRSRIAAVGVSSAGPVDLRTGTVSPINIPDWRDFPLAEWVRGLFHGLPLVLACDGVALAAAEHAFGAARPYADALCMTVSTGVGGGLVLDGRVYPGPSGNAGHIGHIAVELDGAPCACGGRGCVETLASGPALVRWAEQQGWAPPNDRPATAAELAAAATAGDDVGIAAFDRAGRALAAAVAATAALVDVRVAVIGGGVAQTGDLLLDPIRRHLSSYARLSFARDVAVVPAAFGPTACLVGAARLAFAAAETQSPARKVNSE